MDSKWSACVCEVDGHTKGVCVFHHPSCLLMRHHTEESEDTRYMKLKVVPLLLDTTDTWVGVDLPDQLLQYYTAQNLEVVQKGLPTLLGHCCHQLLHNLQGVIRQHDPQGVYGAAICRALWRVAEYHTETGQQ